jgi:gamma-glutamylcyclotransferase (GGCT)/AIG2-like uncharacterized protein YtfP
VKGTFSKIRTLFEYSYQDKLASLIERRITNREIALTDDDVSILKELDTLLNYFEHVLYLENDGHMSNGDRQAVFEYWFELMLAPECGGLRRYIDTFGFERIERALCCTQKKEYIALYGSLMKTFNGVGQLGVEGKLKYVSKCEISGKIYDLGEYPGLVFGDGVVVGELYEICDLSVFKILDKFERYYPEDRGNSLFIRTCLKLENSEIDAWIYAYTNDISENKRVTSGDWEAYSEEHKLSNKTN